MKVVAENYAASLAVTEDEACWFRDDMFLSRLGTELRMSYAELTESDQPRHLTELAEMIDARLTEHPVRE